MQDKSAQEAKQKLKDLDPLLEEMLLKMARKPEYINEIKENPMAYDMLKAYLARRGIRQGYPQGESKMPYKRKEVVVTIKDIKKWNGVILDDPES